MGELRGIDARLRSAIGTGCNRKEPLIKRARDTAGAGDRTSGELLHGEETRDRIGMGPFHG